MFFFTVQYAKALVITIIFSVAILCIIIGYKKTFQPGKQRSSYPEAPDSPSTLEQPLTGFYHDLYINLIESVKAEKQH